MTESGTERESPDASRQEGGPSPRHGHKRSQASPSSFTSLCPASFCGWTPTEGGHCLPTL